MATHALMVLGTGTFDIIPIIWLMHTRRLGGSGLLSENSVSLSQTPQASKRSGKVNLTTT